MKYQHLAGFMSNLTAKLADIDTDLPIHEQHISVIKKVLNTDKYTYLKLFDGTKVEYIKALNLGGKVHIERGLELTEPTSFPVGTCVKWELTPMAVRDIVCQMPCCP